ncbi:Lipocalin/cytosolic fatty-acid binding domain [Trinorchestia longiramus]|nr:Lipocalin/cytosolic fatty-acid binding domain [Trinorchestia longiramus]
MKGLLLLLFMTTIASTQGHDWALGACPSVKPLDNLAVDKFLGFWYVIEQFDTSSLCLTLNYTRVSESELKVTKLRQFSALDRVGIEHTNSYSGDLDMPHENDLARMRVKWPLNIAGKGDYIVFDTDYTNYAGIYECQTVTALMHRKSAAILSREPTLAPEFVDRVKRRLTSFGISTRHFDRVSHQGCRSRADADVNLHVDGDTFTSVVSGARDGIEDAASTFMKGIRDLATTVSSATQNTFNSFQGGDSDTASKNEGELQKPVEETINEGLGAAGETINKGVETVEETLKKGVEAAEEALGDAVDKVEDALTGVNEFTIERNGDKNAPADGTPLPDENINSVHTDDSLQENFYAVQNAPELPAGDVIDTVVRVE